MQVNLTLFFPTSNICIRVDIISPDECEDHQDHPDIMSNDSKSKIIPEESRHSKEISPIMCLFAHPTYERK